MTGPRLGTEKLRIVGNRGASKPTVYRLNNTPNFIGNKMDSAAYAKSLKMGKY